MMPTSQRTLQNICDMYKINNINNKSTISYNLYNDE